MVSIKDLLSSAAHVEYQKSCMLRKYVAQEEADRKCEVTAIQVED